MSFLSDNTSTYTGTRLYNKVEFPITYKSNPVFVRYFDGSDPNIVILAANDSGNVGTAKTNAIFMENHFFVSGEEVEYGSILGQPIGIATTSIPGIGLTDKLPNKVFIRKIDETYFQFSATPEDSLKTIPKLLDITSVGIGTSHYIKSKNKNKKVLITIDNVIQTPINPTTKTANLTKRFTVYDNIFECDSTKYFSTGDILKINNEIVKVESSDYDGRNKVLVRRAFMGSRIANHENGSTVAKLTGTINIVENSIHFASPPYGETPIPDPEDFSYTDVTGITTRSRFSGRVFIRSGVPDGFNETYLDNYIFDDISHQFTGISSNFTLTVSGNNIVDVSDKNFILLVNNVPQFPTRDNNRKNYDLSDDNVKTNLFFENEGINQRKYDINATGMPVGGSIIFVGSSSGSGYQTLIPASGKLIINDGSIDEVLIENKGSGYRSINESVDVGVILNGNNIKIGEASVINGSIQSVEITNPLSGIDSSAQPELFFEYPIGYENIPLIYSQDSQPGIGTDASIDVLVSNDGSILDFSVRNFGYGYKEGDILTVSTDPIFGVPKYNNTSEEFKLVVEKTRIDSFSAWSIGELEILDSPKKYFDGVRKVFKIMINGVQKSIIAAKGSIIDIQSTLLVFLNDVLQVPGEGYFFKGGSLITFSEPPKPDDKCEILFYRGTKDVDVVDVDVLETIQIGDIVNIEANEILYDEDDRLVKDIISVDSIMTDNYSGPGINTDRQFLRPIEWCKSMDDRFVDGMEAPKSRVLYEPLIYPTTNIIQGVGIGSTATIYVENIKTFFDSKKESLDERYSGIIEIISQTLDNNLNNVIEKFEECIYFGDYGKITNIDLLEEESAIEFTFSIEEDSPLRDPSIVKNVYTISTISSGDYFVIRNSNVGYGITTLNTDGSTLSIGSSFIDNVYQVYDTYVMNDEVKIISKVGDFNNLQIDLENSLNYYGDYSWGKIISTKRRIPKEFKIDINDSGKINIQTSPVVRRSYPLKYYNYIL